MSQGFLADLLAPANLSPSEFFEKYWQKAPIHIPRPQGESSAFQSLFSISDMEEMWQNAVKGGYQGSDSVLIFKNGKQVQMSNPFFAFANEHSVVVNKGDRFSSAIFRICKLLEKDTFPFAFVNVYLTPPNAQTVPAHSDDREVLLFQIEGAKEWLIYDDPPVQLPYRNEEVGKRTMVSPEEKNSRKRLVQTTVTAGDVLYMPRGYVHEARTTSQMSLHLTVALQSSDWDYARLVQTHVRHILRSPSCHTARECVPVMNMRPEVPVWARAKKGMTKESETAAREQDEDKQLESMRGAYKTYRSVVATVMDELDLKTSGEETGKASSYAHLGEFEELLSDYHRSVCGEITAERDDLVHERLRVVEHPLTLDSMVLWNNKVKFLGTDFLSKALAQERGPGGPGGVPTAQQPGLPYMLHFDRSGDEMSMGATEQTGPAVAQLVNNHQLCPITVRELTSLSSDLARLCFVNLLLGNGCLLRVS